MTRFLLVRHGQTHWNTQRRIQGLTDVELSSEGLSQAQKLATRLKTETINAMYSSHLSRAHETAKAVAAHHPHLTIRLNTNLAEFGMGPLEGKVIEDIHAEIGDAFWTDDAERSRLGMELTAPAVEYFKNWIAELTQLHKDETVLMSSHGGKLMRFLEAFRFSPKDKEQLKTKYLGNCSLTIVEADQDQHRLALYSSESHL